MGARFNGMEILVPSIVNFWSNNGRQDTAMDGF
jgi:hypothetical protein